MCVFVINKFIPSIRKEHTSWANQLLKKGKRRLISDIRRSMGDGQTLVYILETLGRWWYIFETAITVFFFVSGIRQTHLYRSYSCKENKGISKINWYMFPQKIFICMLIFHNPAFRQFRLQLSKTLEVKSGLSLFPSQGSSSLAQSVKICYSLLGLLVSIYFLWLLIGRSNITILKFSHKFDLILAIVWSVDVVWKVNIMWIFPKPQAHCRRTFRQYSVCLFISVVIKI